MTSLGIGTRSTSLPQAETMMELILIGLCLILVLAPTKW
jgi:hypothetical protein